MTEKMSGKGKFGILGVVAVMLFCLVFGGKLIENNSKTTYQIKQSVLGKISCRMLPGPYYQGFGSIDTWNKNETLFYTRGKDSKSDKGGDNSIEVRFNGGGLANIESTMRVQLPTVKTEAQDLVTVHGYLAFDDLAEKLLRPTVRKCQKRAASLMSAIESAKERRSEYASLVKDQLENGPYILDDEMRPVKDTVTGKIIQKKFKIIKKSKNGMNMHEASPLVGKGIIISNYEVKGFGYKKEIKAQIDAQLGMIMKIQTQKAASQLAEQEALTIAAQGEKSKTEAKYAQEIITSTQTEISERDKKLKLIEADKRIELEQKAKEEELVKANKKKELADIALKTALINKKKTVAEGEAIAKYNELINKQGATPEMKLEAYVRVMEAQFAAYGAKASPTVLNVSGGGGGTTALDSQQMSLMNSMNLVALEKLGINLKGMKQAK